MLLSLSTEQITNGKFAGFVGQAKVQQLSCNRIRLMRNHRFYRNFINSFSGIIYYFKVLSAFLIHRFDYTSLLLYKQFLKSKIAQFYIKSIYLLHIFTKQLNLHCWTTLSPLRGERNFNAKQSWALEIQERVYPISPAGRVIFQCEKCISNIRKMREGKVRSPPNLPHRGGT